MEELKIDSWQITDFLDSNNLKFIKTFVDDFIISLEPGDSYLLYKLLKEVFDKNDSKLKKQNLNLYNKYHVELKKLEVLSIINFSLDQIKNILKDNLLFIFKNKLPILTLLVSYTRWLKEDFYINISAFTGSIRENEEKLGSENVSYSVNKGRSVPLIKDWVNDYIIFTEGRPSRMNGLGLSGYISNNEDVKKLNSEDQTTLKRIIKLFNIFANPENYGNYYKQPYIFDVNEVSDDEETTELQDEFGKDLDKEKNKNEFLDSYNKIISEYFANIESKTIFDDSEIINRLDRAISEKDIKLVMNLLFNLIENSKFSLLEKVSIFNTWQVEFIKGFAGLDTLSLSNKDQRIILHGQFLKMLFDKNFSLKNHDSVIIMIHLANILKKHNEEKYLSLTFADLKDNNFYWRDIVAEEGKLVLK